MHFRRFWFAAGVVNANWAINPLPDPRSSDAALWSERPDRPEPRSTATSWFNSRMGSHTADSAERIEVQRFIGAPAAEIFAVLCDPQGHVAVDATGMLQSAEGKPAAAMGDTFVVHMDRESLGDIDMGKYDVTVTISKYEKDREIAWTILGRMRPQIGHIYGYQLESVEGGTKVTQYYDWSQIHPEWRERNIFPIISELALRSTLGILERAVLRGYPAGPKVVS